MTFSKAREKRKKDNKSRLNEISNQKSKKKLLRVSLRLLRRLGPNLHKRINQRITRERKQHTDRRIPPAIVVILQIDRVQVIAAAGVLADPALLESIWVDEVVPRPGPCEVRGQVFGAGLALRRVEDGELGFFALDLAVEVDEH
jgi:hypothetical protein